MLDMHSNPLQAAGLLQWHGLFAVAVILAASCAAITYLVTSLQSARGRADGLEGKQIEPPQAPYAVPWLANTLSFAWDTEGYIWRMQKRFGQSPFRMSVAGEKFIIVPGGDLMHAMFKSSREMNNKKVLLTALRDQFGVPERDLDVWRRDDSGIGNKPAPGFESWEPERRAYFSQHRDFHTLLMGLPLDVMTTKFVANFTEQLAKLEISTSSEWTDIPDLYDFLRNEMFRAAVRALCGELLFEVCPNFTEEFWDLDRALTYLLRRPPRWLFPKSHAARDRALNSVKHWHEAARARFDWDNKELVNAEWEPIYGTRLMRARQEMFKGTGHSDVGSAGLDMGMLWAANGNIIPASMWSLLNILRSPNVLARVLAETESSLIPGTDRFDIAVLCSKPLLNSIYLEALRYSVAVAVARNPVGGKVSLGNWTIAPDAVAMSISWFGAHDRSFWNDGPDGSHPVDTFWPERFLRYPDDPASGPIKKPQDEITKTPKAEEEVRQEKTIEDDKAANLVTTGTQNHLYPYGGGVKMCPGRFFAKQEMLASIAALLQQFEIELTDLKAANNVGPDTRYFPVGAMPPNAKVPVRIRSRKNT